MKPNRIFANNRTILGAAIRIILAVSMLPQVARTVGWTSALAAIVLSGVAASSLVAAETPKPARLIIAGMPGFLTATAASYSCIAFEARSTKEPIADVLLTSSGLGAATFSVLTNSLRCEQANGTEVTTITIRNLGLTPMHVRLRIPHDAFPPYSGTATGVVRAIFGTEVESEVSLRLDGTQPNPMKTGALWFVGVALPLALTSLAGYGAWIVQQRRTARTAEESTYKKFIATQYTQLRDLFNVHLPNVVHNAPNDRALGAELLEALQQRGAVQPLPTDTRMSLLDALNNSDRRTMAATLRHAYPIWRMAIETAFNAAGDGE